MCVHCTKEYKKWMLHEEESTSEGKSDILKHMYHTLMSENEENPSFYLSQRLAILFFMIFFSLTRENLESVPTFTCTFPEH
jgi:hypothetical protein